MNIKVLTLAVLSFYIGFLQANAQENDSIVNKNVMVTREFQPTITDAKKLTVAPHLKQPNVEKSKPIYSEISTPLEIKYNVHTLVSKELMHPQDDAKKGFVRLGVGNPLNSLLDFRYPIIADNRNRFDITLNHLGAFGEKKHSKTALKIMYDHLFENFTLYTGVGVTNDFFNYYGKSFNAINQQVIPSVAAYNYGSSIFKTPSDNNISLSQIAGLPLDNTHWRVAGQVGIRSLPLAEGFRYDLSMVYNRFGSIKDKIVENSIGTIGKIEIPYHDNRFGLNINYHNISYQDNLLHLGDLKGYNVFKLNPYYLLEKKMFTLQLGVKTGISIGQGQIFTPSPDVRVELRILPEYMALYGGVTGDLTVNTLNRIYDENRWITQETRPADTYTPIDAYIGIKFSPVYNLMIDLFGQHKVISNQYFYVNRVYSLHASASGIPVSLKQVYHHRFDVVYSQAGKSSLGMRIAWDYKDIASFYAKGVFNDWAVESEIHAWQLPKWEADVGTSVKILNDISVNAQFIFQNGRNAKLLDNNVIPMLSVLDLNLGASYAYRDWLSVFAKIDNILNRKYELYYGYQVQGLNAMLGVSFSF